MDQKVVLEARNVSMQYPGTRALDDVTFHLRRGTVSALIGENGAGKSTLVKILAGVAQPTSGSIVLEGAEIVMRSVRDADAQGIGMIHQELNLCPNLSVAENIFLARELTAHGLLDKKQQEGKGKGVARQVGTSDRPGDACGESAARAAADRGNRQGPGT